MKRLIADHKELPGDKRTSGVVRRITLSLTPAELAAFGEAIDALSSSGGTKHPEGFKHLGRCILVKWLVNNGFLDHRDVPLGDEAGFLVEDDVYVLDLVD